MAKNPTTKTQENSPARPTSRALPISLLRTREHVMEPIRPTLSKIGLTEQKWRILRILKESGPLEQSAIARNACLLLPSLTRILHTMESDGLVTRHQDAADRRRSIVRISIKGSNIVDSHLPVSNAIYASLEQKFGKEKLELLLDLLEEVQAIDL